MLDAHAWIVFLIATLAICLAPGPDMLLVVSSASRGGARSGFEALRGIYTAMTLHVAAAAFGLSALFAASHAAFDVLRVVGAAYLVWLGVAALRGKAAGARGASAPGDAFRRGFLTNVTNPKVIVFFAAFLPQFVVRGGPPVALQLLALGAVFSLVGLAIDVGITFAASAVGRRLLKSARAVRALDAVAGAVMIGLGVDLFAEARPA